MDYKRKEMQFSPDELNDVNNGRNKPLLWSPSFLFPLFPLFFISASLFIILQADYFISKASIMNNVSFLSSFFLSFLHTVI